MGRDTGGRRGRGSGSGEKIMGDADATRLRFGQAGKHCRRSDLFHPMFLWVLRAQEGARGRRSVGRGAAVAVGPVSAAHCRKMPAAVPVKWPVAARVRCMPRGASCRSGCRGVQVCRRVGCSTWSGPKTQTAHCRKVHAAGHSACHGGGLPGPAPPWNCRTRIGGRGTCDLTRHRVLSLHFC